jgi:predicted amidohydrolase YtcJ
LWPSTAMVVVERLSGRGRSKRSSPYGMRPARNRKRRVSRAYFLNPTLIFFNGNVRTMDAARPDAQAIAIAADRIAAVGNNQQIKSLAGPSTKLLNVKGATILPGFIDCHIHLIDYGVSLTNIDLRDIRSIELMKKKVAERTDGSTKWILGGGWDQDKFTEKRYPTRRDLDEASPQNPVLLRRICGHICVVNSAALALASITAKTPNPAGGSIDRDTSGEPTGILRENAMDLVAKLVPALRLEDYISATLTACQHALRAGLTTVHCITGSDLEMRALLDLKANGRLPIRFYVLIPTDQLRTAASLGLRSGLGDEHVRVGGVKIFTDGSLGARTAALEAPYADDPENRGVAVHSQEELEDLFAEAHLSNFQIAVHAIGDRAAGMVLDAIAKAQESAPEKRLRHRIEHASVLNGNIILRMKKLGLLASVQPRFIVSDYWLKERLGPERSSLTYPLRSLLRAGVTVVAGSDCPVEPLTPLSGIEAAVNRRGNEAVTVEEALAFYTRTAAYASFEEDSKGTISPGKLADLVILKEDPRKVKPSMISRIKILGTVVGGRLAHRAGI